MLKLICRNVRGLSEKDFLDLKKLPHKSIIGFGNNSFGLDKCNGSLVVPFQFPHDIGADDSSAAGDACKAVDIDVGVLSE
jgi:hypothetical protein